jgi:dihydroorotase
MNPPLRSEDDRKAIIEGLKDGTIDVIATDHAPHSIEEKEAEYIYAPFGITGLETAIGLIISQLYNTKILNLKDIYDRCVYNPRKILNLEVPAIKKGEKANLSFFELDVQWQYEQGIVYSKSENTPFKKHPLEGRPMVVINKGLIFNTPELKG